MKYSIHKKGFMLTILMITLESATSSWFITSSILSPFNPWFLEVHKKGLMLTILMIKLESATSSWVYNLQYSVCFESLKSWACSAKRSFIIFLQELIFSTRFDFLNRPFSSGMIYQSCRCYSIFCSFQPNSSSRIVLTC